MVVVGESLLKIPYSWNGYERGASSGFLGSTGVLRFETLTVRTASEREPGTGGLPFERCRSPDITGYVRTKPLTWFLEVAPRSSPFAADKSSL